MKREEERGRSGASAGYYKCVQQQIGLPKYNRIKSMASKKEPFKKSSMYKDICKNVMITLRVPILITQNSQNRFNALPSFTHATKHV